MSERINTVDIIGEQELCAALIEKNFSRFSVTEYYDDRIEMVGKYAFANLVMDRITLPSVTGEIQQAAFHSANITTLDLGAPSTIGDLAFYRSTVTSLIFRGENVSSLYNTKALERSSIAYGTGYIYVPASLVDSYKAATNWSTYADQIRALEDYTVDGTTTGELDETKI